MLRRTVTSRARAQVRTTVSVRVAVEAVVEAVVEVVVAVSLLDVKADTCEDLENVSKIDERIEQM